jgi:putative acetyltransferase
MFIRLFQPQDTNQIARLFHDTVRTINTQDYTEAQVKAWAPDDLHFKNWEAHCTQHITYVAEHDEIIAGFAQLSHQGEIDCFYCHKNYQRQGIGKQLYHTIEITAFSLGLPHLFTDASITAKPFFEQMGFEVLHQQEVTCRGESFINYSLIKWLK